MKESDFSPARTDYSDKFSGQHPGVPMRFV